MENVMNRSLLCVALTLAVGASAVFGQTAAVSGRSDAWRGDMRARAQARFDEADTNHDGKLSFAEMQDAENRRLSERFNKLDVNHDGGVSMEEMRQAHQQRREMRERRREHWQGMRQKLQSLDVNHDQALTREEIGNAMPKLAENFDRLDTNHDGKLTRDEMRAMHRMHGPQAPGNR
jgi:Ca2+-binding EF-hand superfamily protein